MYYFKKNFLKIFFLSILSLILISASTLQAKYFHWSAILDQDIMIIYNSLLISSGIEQEYRDHPAYITFFIYEVLIKFFSFFNFGPVSNINDLINSSNPNEVLQKLFLFCRNINVIINILLVFFLYTSLRKLRCDKINSILCCCILIVSGWYTESTFVLRNENLSIIFFLISFIFLIKFLENKNNFSIIIGGFFFGVAMLTKIQIIFLFTFFLFIYFIEINNKIYEEKIIKLTKKNDLILFIFYILFLISYIILQFKLQTYERFEKVKYLDLVLFLLFNSFLILIGLIKNRFNFYKARIGIIILSLFFLGFLFSIFFSILLDLIGLIELNYFILLRITNPFHYMVEFHMDDHVKLYENLNIGFAYFYNVFQIAINKFDYNILKILILFFLLILSIRLDYKNYHDTFRKKFLIKSLLFTSIILIIFIMNLRGFIYYYETLVLVPYILSLAFLSKNFTKQFKIIVNLFLILYFAFCNFSLQEKRKYPFTYYFSSQTSMHLICDPDKIFYQDNSYKFFLQYYQSRFNDEFIIRLCNNNKS